MPITLSRTLTVPEASYLKAFSDTRRMQRHEEEEEKIKDPIRKRAKLPVGKDGAFVVHGQEYRTAIKDYNREPAGQPALWCYWFPSSDGERLVWQNENEPEDAYTAGKWLAWIAENILAAWGIRANGSFEYRTREGGGIVLVKDNDVREPELQTSYVDPWSNETVIIELSDETESGPYDDDD